jgi:hypothetical protein
VRLSLAVKSCKTVPLLPCCTVMDLENRLERLNDFTFTLSYRRARNAVKLSITSQGNCLIVCAAEFFREHFFCRFPGRPHRAGLINMPNKCLLCCAGYNFLLITIIPSKDDKIRMTQKMYNTKLFFLYKM